MDRAALAHFLRRRREVLQPEEVGLERAPRRRAIGLRREEVAGLSRMSADYLSRLEQGRGPHPSPRILASLAATLRLSVDDRDELFRLAGQLPPHDGAGRAHVDAGVLRVFDRLADLPAQVVTGLGETLRQTPLAAALFGDETGFRGPARSAVWRWFRTPIVRERYPLEDRDGIAGDLVGRLADATEGVAAVPARSLVRLLRAESAEFAATWDEIVADRPAGTRRVTEGAARDRSRRGAVLRLEHPVVGTLELHRQRLRDLRQDHDLLVFAAEPGSSSAARLEEIDKIS